MAANSFLYPDCTNSNRITNTFIGIEKFIKEKQKQYFVNM